ncbi:MAG: AraC family transcriptional regulator, partial [Pyrinomonadaceae bacterium]
MDPLSSLVALMRPQTVVSKVVSGSGRWGVRYPGSTNAGFGVVMAGKCHLLVENCEPIELAEGDFILLPTGPGFTMVSDLGVEPIGGDIRPMPVRLVKTHFGQIAGEPDFQLLGGYFLFGAPNVEMLAQVVPTLIHIKCTDNATRRITNAINSLREEALDQRPGRDLILQRLIDVMLIEALRYKSEKTGVSVRPGLLNALADDRIGRALTSFHADVARVWTVGSLAQEAHLSRTAFSERFTRLVGTPPMTYLIKWRMAVAKDMLHYEQLPQDAVAAAVGYKSASAFSTAFRREVGRAPGE